MAVHGGTWLYTGRRPWRRPWRRGRRRCGRRRGRPGLLKPPAEEPSPLIWRQPGRAAPFAGPSLRPCCGGRVAWSSGDGDSWTAAEPAQQRSAPRPVAAVISFGRRNDIVTSLVESARGLMRLEGSGGRPVSARAHLAAWR